MVFRLQTKVWRKHVQDNEVIYSAINTYDGKLTCKNVADSFDCYEYVDVREICK